MPRSGSSGGGLSDYSPAIDEVIVLGSGAFSEPGTYGGFSSPEAYQGGSSGNVGYDMGGGGGGGTDPFAAGQTTEPQEEMVWVDSGEIDEYGGPIYRSVPKSSLTQAAPQPAIEPAPQPETDLSRTLESGFQDILNGTDGVLSDITARSRSDQIAQDARIQQWNIANSDSVQDALGLDINQEIARRMGGTLYVTQDQLRNSQVLGDVLDEYEQSLNPLQLQAYRDAQVLSPSEAFSAASRYAEENPDVFRNIISMGASALTGVPLWIARPLVSLAQNLYSRVSSENDPSFREYIEEIYPNIGVAPTVPDEVFDFTTSFGNAIPGTEYLYNQDTNNLAYPDTTNLAFSGAYGPLYTSATQPEEIIVQQRVGDQSLQDTANVTPPAAPLASYIFGDQSGENLLEVITEAQREREETEDTANVTVPVAPPSPNIISDTGGGDIERVIVEAKKDGEEVEDTPDVTVPTPPPRDTTTPGGGNGDVTGPSRFPPNVSVTGATPPIINEGGGGGGGGGSPFTRPSIFGGTLPAPTGIFADLAPRDVNLDWYRYGFGPEASFFNYAPQRASGITPSSTATSSAAPVGGATDEKTTVGGVPVSAIRPERTNNSSPTPFELAAGVTPYSSSPSVIDISSAKDRDERAAIINPYIEQLAKSRGTTPYSVVYGASTETGANLNPDQVYTVWDPIANGWIGQKGSELRGYNFDIMPSYLEQTPNDFSNTLDVLSRDPALLTQLLPVVQSQDPTGRTYNQLISSLKAMGIQLPEGYASGGRSSFAVKGKGSGRSDEIPARLSDGEYVIDAETVALLGDGSSKAGAERLDQFRVNIRKHKGRNLARGKFSVNAKRPDAYMAGGRK